MGIRKAGTYLVERGVPLLTACVMLLTAAMVCVLSLFYIVSMYNGLLAYTVLLIGGYVVLRFARIGLHCFQVKQLPILLMTPQEKDTIRFVCISDTHGKHALIQDIPHGDVLIHSGDFTKRGTYEEIESFNTWIGTLPHKRKFVIAGNHELSLDAVAYESYWNKWQKTKLDPAISRSLLTNCEYLENTSIDVCGIHVFGSPMSIEIPHVTM